jgi:hypothetical protein
MPNDDLQGYSGAFVFAGLFDNYLKSALPNDFYLMAAVF